MVALLEFTPLLAFLAAYWVGGIYAATTALMAAMVLLLAADLLATRRIPRMHLLSALLVWGLGAATLVLHDVRFIQWKPTVFMWLLALAFLGSAFIGEQPLAQRLLHAVAVDQPLPRRTWLRFNAGWVGFYVLAGAANLWAAWNLSEASWVRFKVIGLTAATMVFAIGQALWLARLAAAQPASPADRPADSAP